MTYVCYSHLKICFFDIDQLVFHCDIGKRAAPNERIGDKVNDSFSPVFLDSRRIVDREKLAVFVLVVTFDDVGILVVGGVHAVPN